MVAARPPCEISDHYSTSLFHEAASRHANAALQAAEGFVGFCARVEWEKLYRSFARSEAARDRQFNHCIAGKVERVCVGGKVKLFARPQKRE